MIDIIGELSTVPPLAAYAVVAVVVLAESILLVGAFMPTLSLLTASGALAAVGHLNVVALVAVASTAVIVGDCLGHRTGRRFGNSAWTQKMMARVPVAALERAEGAIVRQGGWAVLGGRFIPVVRTVTPHLAGMNNIPYQSIAIFSVVAAIVWATAEVSLGYLAASYLTAITQYGALVMAGAVAVTAVCAALIVWIRRTVADRRGRLLRFTYTKEPA